MRMGSDHFVGLLVAGKTGERLVELVSGNEQFLGLACIDLQDEMELIHRLEIGELDEQGFLVNEMDSRNVERLVAHDVGMTRRHFR